MNFPNFLGGEYRGHSLYVVDGDTVDVVLDVGFRLYIRGRGRLLDVDAAELNSRDSALKLKALEARAALSTWLAPGPLLLRHKDTEWPLRVVTKPDPDSFGRFLLSIFTFNPETGLQYSVNKRLLDEGLAVSYA